MPNMEENDLLLKLNQTYKSLSKGQKQLANYIMENYDRAAFITASKMGRIVGVSESTVVRFAYALGYDGYPEFQKALEEWVQNKLNTVQRMSAKYGKSTQSEILSTVLSADIEKIQHTMENLDSAAFETAVDIILEAKKQK